MYFAVIPLIVWGVLAAFSGGAGVGIGYVWGKHSPDKPQPVVNNDGTVAVFPDPADCVVSYYDAVMKCNYGQYQYCVLEPISIEKFKEKANKRLEEMDKHGNKPVKLPIRGRSNFKVNKGSRSANVCAVSPWTHKEEAYLVIEQGQSWKIAKEK